MEQDIISKKDYYDQLHQTSRLYQTELWAIPAIFFGLQGLFFQALDWRTISTFSIKNFIILFANAIFSFLMWLTFEKHHAWVLLLQNKIDKLDKLSPDEDKIPMYSMGKARFAIEMAKWEIDKKESKNIFAYRLRFAAFQTV